MNPVLPVYRRSDIAMVRGEGVYLYDDAGKKYLDFASGIAVNALGHCHPHLVKALQEQSATLWHCSNLYRMPGQEKLAERLVQATFADTVFFCSSGTEAVEAGIKMVRKHFHEKGENRYRIITVEGAFHGRTYGGISASGAKQAVTGYAPLLPGFDHVTFGDVAALEAAITPETAAILLEPVQGEGGIRVLPPTYLQAARQLCDRHGLLLFLDEVQCGMGRTGTLFAHEQAGITPDVMSVAKGIGNGFPLAALLATERAASGMTPGSHGSTYGANPLAMAVGNVVLDIMQEASFLKQLNDVSCYFRNELQRVQGDFPEVVVEIRGLGLMLALVLHESIDYRSFAERMRHDGLLTVPAVAPQVIRLLPPLTITNAHVDEAVATIRQHAQAQKKGQ